jgi:cytochrome c-type biogenesis protein CcmH/NrfF
MWRSSGRRLASNSTRRRGDAEIEQSQNLSERRERRSEGWRQRVSLRACGPVFVIALLAAVALAQTVAEKPGVDVRRVATRLACQCGCKDSVATCSMLECSFSKPAKERIARMQAVGMSDEQIIQAFIRDYGQGIYLAPPSPFGWIVPYASVGAGLVVIWLFLRKHRKPKPLAEPGPVAIDDPALEKYKDQIETDLSNLE